MAKMLLMRPPLRPHAVAFFSSRLLSYSSPSIVSFSSVRPAKFILSGKGYGIKPCGGGYAYKLEGGLAVMGGRLPLSVRATTQVNDPGSVDSPLIQSMEKKIKEHLNAESVIVKDAYGDGRHVSIDVVATVFEGQSPVNRQRMVYKAIWEELQNTVHAVDQMTTRTPNEAGATSGEN